MSTGITGALEDLAAEDGGQGRAGAVLLLMAVAISASAGPRDKSRVEVVAHERAHPPECL